MKFSNFHLERDRPNGIALLQRWRKEANTQGSKAFRGQTKYLRAAWGRSANAPDRPARDSETTIPTHQHQQSSVAGTSQSAETGLYGNRRETTMGGGYHVCEDWEGWLNVAVIFPLYSRKVVGWSTSAGFQRDIVWEAIRMAWGRRPFSGGLMHHSDRGRQYASKEFQHMLRDHGIDMYHSSVSIQPLVKGVLTTSRRLNQKLP